MEFFSQYAFHSYLHRMGERRNGESDELAVARPELMDVLLQEAIATTKGNNVPGADDNPRPSHQPRSALHQHKWVEEAEEWRLNDLNAHYRRFLYRQMIAEREAESSALQPDPPSSMPHFRHLAVHAPDLLLTPSTYAHFYVDEQVKTKKVKVPVKARPSGGATKFPSSATQFHHPSTPTPASQSTSRSGPVASTSPPSAASLNEEARRQRACRQAERKKLEERKAREEEHRRAVREQRVSWKQMLSDVGAEMQASNASYDAEKAAACSSWAEPQSSSGIAKDWDYGEKDFCLIGFMF